MTPDLDAFFSSIGTDFDPLLADGEAAESSQLKKASRMCNMGLHLLNEALNASCAEVCTAQFRPKGLRWRLLV
ncbi:hypothetical protein HID58_048112 [Brassica napus]|uniref:Uncharacterized protein n=1 Tax=Brassica napus TaxID=3708 RepID=A0ABQ8B1A5_BRANA|nr:hypothetical protein HID58_048112 [Brassica napus]